MSKIEPPVKAKESRRCFLVPAGGRIILTLLACLLFAMAGCAPRGETITLDELLKNEIGRYQRMSRVEVNTDVRQLLSGIDGSLQQLLGRESIAGEDLVHLSDLLSRLHRRSGYTSRPAFAELIKQYRVLELNITEESVSDLPGSSLRLLAARTYSLLSTELETTRFAL